MRMYSKHALSRIRKRVNFSLLSSMVAQFCRSALLYNQLPTIRHGRNYRSQRNGFTDLENDLLLRVDEFIVWKSFLHSLVSPV